MTTVDRRTFLRVLGSGALAAAAPGPPRCLAGHVEDGRDSASDPAIGDMGRAND
jgi:hypothetical protein